MTKPKTYFVIDQKPLPGEAKKPAELIQVTGHENLSLAARRSITLLWHNAHSQGIQENKDYIIEIDDLIGSRHKGYEIVEESIESLMKTLVTVRHADGSTTRVQFLGGNDLAAPDRPAGTFRYTFDKRLIEILRNSTIWGKINFPVLMALSSKYGISLYENAAQLSGLDHKTNHVYTLADFRTMLGVEKRKYPTFGGLNQQVIKPSVQEINALAEFHVSVAPIKTGKKVTHIRLGWWSKSLDEIKSAFSELQQPKVGRRARIQGTVSYVLDTQSSLTKVSRKSLQNEVIDRD
jgi:hypothetical protein